MSTASTTTNGKPQRKQLSDQLDRLDGILDALGEGLPAAVADACREGARQAVRDAIVEVISNSELRALLAPQIVHTPPVPTASPKPTRPGLWTKFKSRLTTARSAVGRAANVMTGSVISRYRAVRDGIAAVAHATGEVLPVRRVLGVAAGIGVTIGVTCLVVPQTTAAIIGGIGATCTAVSVQVGSWLRRAARRVGLV